MNNDANTQMDESAMATTATGWQWTLERDDDSQ